MDQINKLMIKSCISSINYFLLFIINLNKSILMINFNDKYSK